MGIISWVKDKYYELRYNKADALYRNCQYEEAIQILKDIQDSYSRATNLLLEVYHKQIEMEDAHAVTYIADLYESHNDIKDSCISFGRRLGNINKKKAISYSSVLYQKGIETMSDIFIKNAREYVLQSKEEISINDLTTSSDLINKLVDALYADLQDLYQNKNIDQAIRLSCILLPHKQNHTPFLELYHDIRWMQFSSRKITPNNISDLDNLLEELHGKMSNSYINKIERNIYELSKKNYEVKQYLPALLLSYRICNKFDEVQTIYKDSAYHLYENESKNRNSGVKQTSFIDKDVLYKTFGEGTSRINELERFFRFGSEFQSKYVEIVTNQLHEYARKNNVTEAITLLIKACDLKYQKDFFVRTISGETENFSEAIVTDIITNHKKLLNVKKHSDDFVNQLLTLSDKEFVLNGLECLIKKGCNISKQYSSFIILSYLEGRDLTQQIETLNHAISKVTDESLLNKKVEVCCKYIEKNPLGDDFIESQCTTLKKKHPEIQILLSYISINNALAATSDIKKNETTIKEIINNVLSELNLVPTQVENISEKILKELWENILSLEEKVYQSSDDNTKLAIYATTQDSLSNFANFKERQSIIDSIVHTIDQLHYNIGEMYEKSKKYQEAINEYYHITDKFNQKDDVSCRISLCNLKDGKLLEKEQRKKIKTILQSKATVKLKKDLAFRFCLYLIGNEEIEEAESINGKYLNDEEISSLCNDKNIQRQESTLKKLNEQIAQLSQGTLTANDALLLEQELSQTLNDILALVIVSKQDEESLRDVISTYILDRLYQEGQFVQCQKRLTIKGDTYLSDLINLRNIAIMCLSAAEGGQLDDTTYKEFIALWVTAVYQQEIFIKSLDYTSWDDPYTFTLNDALGILYDNSDLPDNVGYDDETLTDVVSIREVQKALINRMEVALKAYPKYLQFLNEQIKAIDLLSEQELDVPCVVVAPHLLQLSKTYKQEVTNSLQTEEQGHYDNWERILHIGNLYGIKTANFEKYLSAEKYMSEAKEYLLNNRGNAHTAFDSSRIDAIREFSDLFSSLLSVVMTELKKSIAQEIGYIEIGKKYYEICKVLQDDNVSFVFTRYVNQEIVDAYNKKVISSAKCATVLYDVYKIHKGNVQLNNNLQNIVPILIIEGSQESQQAVDRILCDTHDFDKIANEARLIAQLKQIVDKVNNQILSECDALEQVYNLYKTNTSNASVCDNLAQLVTMCVDKYVMGSVTGKQRVCRVLDNLKNNMSATFKQNNKTIGDYHNRRWNQLPYEVQSALQGSAIYSLTQQGLSLKQGFDYLKALM